MTINLEHEMFKFRNSELLPLSECKRKEFYKVNGNYELIFLGNHPLLKVHKEHNLAIYSGYSGESGHRVYHCHIATIHAMGLTPEQFLVRFHPSEHGRGFPKFFEDHILDKDKLLVWNILTGFGNGPTTGRNKDIHSWIDFIYPRLHAKKAEKNFGLLKAPCPLSKLGDKLEKIRFDILNAGYPVEWTVADILKLMYLSPAGYKCGKEVKQWLEEK